MTDVEAVAGDLALVARGEADPASVFAGTEPLPLREAAEMIESATDDPVGFAARHGDAARHALDVGPEGLARLRRLLRRDDALAVLYGAEQRGGPPSIEGLGDEAVALAMGTWEDRADLDRAIGEAAVGWTVARMPPVDRSILRSGWPSTSCCGTRRRRLRWLSPKRCGWPRPTPPRRAAASSTAFSVSWCDVSGEERRATVTQTIL